MKIRESGLPFDDFRTLLKQLPPLDDNALEHTTSQVSDRLGEHHGLLGELCLWYAGWSGRSPSVNRPVMTLFAGTHAVDTGFDVELLAQLELISSGNSPVNRVCHQNEVGLKVLDLALQIPVADICVEAALDEKSCAGTIAFGMEAIAGGTDLLCAAALEDAPNISCLAILSLLSEIDPASAGLEVDELSLQKVVAARKLHGLAGLDGFEILRRLGGREAAAICGAILAARSQHIPTLLAGPTALTCAAILEKMQPGSTSHCRLAQSTGNTVLDELAKAIGLKTVISDFAVANPAIQLGLAAGWIRSACHLMASN
ncbi:MAG: nicotinate-nucleotide--dimethylbenzimidazole phosphoribosyltransferase [Pseudomonadota bacterium]